jgi:sulfite reductase (NADPH) flavoprotein alpha-component
VPTLIPILPDSAPFTSGQRAWLNGFFAGVLGGSHDAPPAIADAPAASSPAASAPTEDEPTPWHDPTLSLDDRMALAEGKPFARRLMAAMAQLDCGACGYVCKTYSEAIAQGQEKDLTRCTPGGKPTAKKLRELVALADAVGQNANGTAHTGVNGSMAGGTNRVSHSAAPPPASTELSRDQSSSAITYDRKNPFLACVKSVDKLNQEGSEKDTRHVVINLSGSGIAYEPGDSLGVYPFNCGDLVNEILALSGLGGDEPVTNFNAQAATLRNVLLTQCDLAAANERLVDLLVQNAADPADAARLTSLAAEDGGSLIDAADVVDLLQICRPARLAPQELLAALAPLQPRLYSISSSLRAHPAEVHLTVGVVRYQANNRARKGVCSTFLADRVKPGDPLRVYVQRSHGFRLPANSSLPIIMVGPGTGIAPFRAFLEERQAAKHTGKNWLFFGDQRERCDFLFERELHAYLNSGLLTRLSTAFSRDGDDKVYVQHRMLESAQELWRWLDAGAHFYVCGDAKRMAHDVDQALACIVRDQGGLSPDGAQAFLQELRKSNRYQRDVY